MTLSLAFWLVALGMQLRAEETMTLQEFPGGENNLAFSPDGRRIAYISGISDNSLRLWDTSTGELRGNFEGHRSSILSLAFSPDGTRLASASDDETVKVWDVASGKVVTTLIGNLSIATSVAFSPDGMQLASGSEEGTVILWDVDTSQKVATLGGHLSSITSVAFSPDGSRLASGSDDGTVKLWDPATGKEVATLEGHSDSVRSVAFSPDGSRLASGSDDSTVKLWDAESWERLANFAEHGDWVRSVAFSPDGKFLASGSDDSTIKLWDVATGAVVATFQGHLNFVMSVSYSRDGMSLASGSLDGTVKTWDISKALESQRLRPLANDLYQSLYESARFLDRREGLIAESVPAEVLEMVIQIAGEKAGQDSESSKETLNGFMNTRKTDGFDETQDSNYQNAQISRDGLARSLLVIKAAAESGVRFADSELAKARLAGLAVSKWTEIAGSFTIYYPELSTDESYIDMEEKDQAWYRRLQFTARRNVLTGDELLKASPEALVALVAEEEREDYLAKKAELLCLESRQLEVAEICRALAKENPVTAGRVADAALLSFTVPADHGGRSPRAMSAAAGRDAADFGRFIQGLNGIEGLAWNREEVPKLFAKFCSFHRPVKKGAIEAVLSPLPERSEAEMDLFVTEMLRLLNDVITPSPKGDDPAKKIGEGDEEWAARISGEYEAFDAVLQGWRAGKDSWHRDFLRAKVQIQWASHQFGYVENEEDSDEAEPGGAGEMEVTKTDVTGYLEHVAEWRRLIESAAEGLLADGTLEGPAKAEAVGGLLSSWVEFALKVDAHPAYRKEEGADLLDDIRSWIGLVPEDLREAALDRFAGEQLERLDPPIVETKEKGEELFGVEHQQKYDFVKTVASLAPATSAGRLFNGFLDEYEALREGVRFFAIPEGELYDSGAWAEGALPTVPVDGGEFGLWFTLVHTPEAEAKSGSFRRYTENAPQRESGEFRSLNEAERTQYADDFKRQLEGRFSASFDVLLVEPCPRPKVRRRFEHAKADLRETPLYYAVLRPKNTIGSWDLPPVRMDLDFPHDFGSIILPFESPRLELKAVPGKVSHVREVELEQELDDSRRDMGELTLTVTSESLGLPPAPHRLAHGLPPAGFEMDSSAIDTRIELLSLPDGPVLARVRRTTTYRFDWLGAGSTTTFHFPTYPVSDEGAADGWKVDHFIKLPKGQISERRVPKGWVPVGDLPWRGDFLAGYVSTALRWGSIALVGVLLVWSMVRFRKRPRPVEAKRFPLTRPTTDKPLATARFLRRIESSPDIGLSDSQRQSLREDVETLENHASREDEGSPSMALALVDKWLEIARKQWQSNMVG